LGSLMADDVKTESDDKKQLEGQVESRRNFTKSGIAGGAVLMSLLSRPALGTGFTDPRCSGSVLASIDAGSSLHNFDPEACRMGCTPGFWCYGQPPDTKAWDRIKQLTGVDPWWEFSALFGCGPGPGFAQGTELNQILCIPNENTSFLKQSARHSIAAWLNATIMSGFFELTPQQVVNGYCTAYTAWKNNNNNTGPLINWHSQMASLNERNCPLNNDANNFFYHD
ncbi:MAG: hypothetical protein KDI20_16050, partial [Pseudomonadales bacterium]|nr:hypothetical protein [Pseudomonadales bacterium]